MNFSPDQFTPPNDMQVFLPAGEVTGLAGILLAVYALVMFAYSMLGLISYVLHSLGLYTIAKRRGIHNSWLAWLPFGNLGYSVVFPTSISMLSRARSETAARLCYGLVFR